MNRFGAGGDRIKVGGKTVRVGRAWYDSPWRIASTALSIVVGLILLALIAAMFVIPRLTGGASLTVLSGSMRPALDAGDLIVVRGLAEEDVCREVLVGDIITFFPEPGNPELITHRVVAKSAGSFPDGARCQFITRGDDNTMDDPPVSPAQVRGVFMYSLPRLGWVRQWVSTQPQTLVIGAVVLIAAYAAWTWLRPPKKRARIVTGAEAAALLAAQGDAPAGQAATEAPAAASSEGHAPLGEAEREARLLELELRQRELAVRERELALREMELGVAPATPTAMPTPLPSRREVHRRREDLEAAGSQEGLQVSE
ncbi:MAG: signal peptidase I [Promicromonosporaceae bacterium]|nr:signal peptidase I [Promicromonosporaceae bacterium]